MRWTTSCCLDISDARCASIAPQAETPSASPIAINLRTFDERIFFPVCPLFALIPTEFNYSRARIEVNSRCPKLVSYSIEWYARASDPVAIRKLAEPSLAPAARPLPQPSGRGG